MCCSRSGRVNNRFSTMKKTIISRNKHKNVGMPNAKESFFCSGKFVWGRSVLKVLPQIIHFFQSSCVSRFYHLGERLIRFLDAQCRILSDFILRWKASSGFDILSPSSFWWLPFFVSTTSSSINELSKAIIHSPPVSVYRLNLYCSLVCYDILDAPMALVRRNRKTQFTSDHHG